MAMLPPRPTTSPLTNRSSVLASSAIYFAGLSSLQVEIRHGRYRQAFAFSSQCTLGDLRQTAHPLPPPLFTERGLQLDRRNRQHRTLRRLRRRKKLQCAGPAAALLDYKQFAKLLRRLHRHDWVVYAKPAFGGPMQVLRYLGRYTHRVAISNHRLLALERERVTFRWKDYARGGKQAQMTLVATEFLRRFFLHVLPKGFVRIRHFGFLANRFRASRLALGRRLLTSGDSTEQEVKTNNARSESSSLWHCPRCGASMIVIQRFTAVELSACMYFDSS